MESHKPTANIWRVKVSKIKRRLLKHTLFLRITAIFFVILALIGFFAGVGVILSKYRFGQYVSPAASFIFSSNASIKNSEGKTNILLLGRGGEGHDAPELTDTIILVSISQNPPKVTMVSFPRDLYLVSKQLKINHAFLEGTAQGGTKAGLEMAKDVVSEVSGVPIDYVVLVDFGGFTKLIDALGGVEVDVERSFTDNKFPIPGKENDLCGGDLKYACRYETISFEQGKQQMDGATALKFARSRHSQNILEGNDLARAARQQKIIAAIKDKVLSTDLIFNPDRVSEMVKIIEDSVETDLTPEEGAVLARLAFNARDSIASLVLGSDLLYEPSVSPRRYFGQYVLLPKQGEKDFGEIQSWVRNLLSN
jgi:LCP family protein required for cell wall assembly